MRDTYKEGIPAQPYFGASASLFPQVTTELAATVLEKPEDQGAIVTGTRYTPPGLRDAAEGRVPGRARAGARAGAVLARWARRDRTHFRFMWKFRTK